MASASPYANSSLARFVTARIAELRPKKTQRDIATQTGFVNPNMLSLIKSGKSKLPLDRVTAFADALEEDRRYVLRLALGQAGLETTEAEFDAIVGPRVSENEAEWVEAIREASGDTNPKLTQRRRGALFAIF